jgi:hypothetical protein
LTLRSEEFELTGQLDYLLVADNCVIGDYKTGAILDSEGRMKAHYRNQLLLYGMLANECGYGLNFELNLAGSDSTQSFRFDRANCADLEQRLKAASNLAPLGRAVDQESLASVGGGCVNCNFRPGCGQYRKAAPDLWRSAPTDSALPPDTWGTVREVFADASGEDYVAVHLVDAVDRFVAVTGIPKRHFGGVPNKGMTIAVYGAFAHKSGPGHPLNYAIAVPGNPVSSRHAAVVIYPDG